MYLSLFHPRRFPSRINLLSARWGTSGFYQFHLCPIVHSDQPWSAPAALYTWSSHVMLDLCPLPLSRCLWSVFLQLWSVRCWASWANLLIFCSFLRSVTLSGLHWLLRGKMSNSWFSSVWNIPTSWKSNSFPYQYSPSFAWETHSFLMIVNSFSLFHC